MKLRTFVSTPASSFILLPSGTQAYNIPTFGKVLEDTAGGFSAAMPGVITVPVEADHFAASAHADVPNGDASTADVGMHLFVEGSGLTVSGYSPDWGHNTTEAFYHRHYAAVTADSGGYTSIGIDTGGDIPVTPVYAMPVVDSGGSGSFTLTVPGSGSATVQYSSTGSTLSGYIQTALTSILGSATQMIVSGAPNTLADIRMWVNPINTTWGYFEAPPSPPTIIFANGATGFSICGVAAGSTTAPIPLQRVGQRLTVPMVNSTSANITLAATAELYFKVQSEISGNSVLLSTGVARG